MSLTDRSTLDEPAATPRRHTTRNVAIVVGVVLVALVALLATRGPSGSVTTRIVGQAAPEFRGSTLDGQTFQMSAHQGEWVVVNFFATWCTPCRLEHPELVAFAQQHEGDPVQVVSVAYDDQTDALRTFFAEEGGTWPVVAADTGRVALDYGVTGVPETYLVAPSGLVVAGIIDGFTVDKADAIIDAAGGMALAAGA